MKDLSREKQYSAIGNGQSTFENDRLTPAVARVMRISETTWGTSQQKFLVRYRGQLLIDSEIAYDQLAEALHPQGITLYRSQTLL